MITPLNFRTAKERAFSEYRFSRYTYRLYRSKLRFIHSLRFAALFRALSPQLHSLNGTRVAEIGCSDLFMLCLLKESKIFPKEYLGIDIFWEGALMFAEENAAAIRAMAQTSVELRDQSACEPIKCERVDAVLMLETLEHLPDETAALDNVARILRPGGLLILSVPVEFGYVFALKELARTCLKIKLQYSLKEFWAALHGDMSKVSRIVGDHKGYDFRSTRHSLISKGWVLEKESLYPFAKPFLAYNYLSAWRRPEGTVL